MLQLRQLDRVATRYPQHIAAVRDLFADAGPEPRGPESLAEVARRIDGDAAFRRDLAGLLMVFAHGGVTGGDMLGIVALAASDAATASATREQDAHEVLRFILASSAPEERQTATPAGGHFRWAWLLIVTALLAVAVLGTVRLLHRPSSEPSQSKPNGAATVVVPQDDTHAGHTDTATSSTGPAVVPLPSRSHPLPAAALQHETSTGKVVSSGTPKPASELVANSEAPVETVAAVPERREPLPAVEPRTSSTPAVQTQLQARTPTALLSRLLGARTLPANDPAIDPVSGHPYPRLWRRHPDGSASPDTASSTMLAANVPPLKPGANAVTASPGTVRPVSLGMMAANILYSPAPAYPAAAVAAHVQGQVTIQAEIDRGGSVASARVVSGPPLLREAALEAVLRWRYRPHIFDGKAATAADTAVVDFELPSP